MAKARTFLTHSVTFLAGMSFQTLLSIKQLTYQCSSANFQGTPIKVDGNVDTVRNGVSYNASTIQTDILIGNTMFQDISNDSLSLHIIEMGQENSTNLKMKQSDTNLQSDFTNMNQGVCSIFPQPTPSTLSLWSQNLPHILNSTIHPDVRNDFKYHDFKTLLLHFMTPDRLQRSIKTLPLDWKPIEKGLDIIHRRWKFIQMEINSYRNNNKLDPEEAIPSMVLNNIQSDQRIPRKLNILVMGGSVTLGVVCHINPVSKAVIARRSCAWPGRMNSFFSSLFGGYDLVQFHNIALGGTNTESGTTLWDYSLLPADVPYPDVVINAYATNDMHYNTMQDALAKNISLERNLMDMSQVFLRQLLTPKRECGHPPPLVLYLDDYLGNEQNEVLTTMISSKVMHLMSQYYGIGFISYADTVRDLVFGDTREKWFSSNWYEKGSYQRAVHPNMGMHIANVWVVAFFLMNLVTTYCSLPMIHHSPRSEDQYPHLQAVHRRLHAGLNTNSKGVWDYGYQPHHGMPSLKASMHLIGGPKQKPFGIPPLLTYDVSLENISQLWQIDALSSAHLWRTEEECLAQGKDLMDNVLLEKPCMYSWVAQLEPSLNSPERLIEKLNLHITDNHGWNATDDNSKVGWVPTAGLGSKFVMEWKNVTQPVRAVTWMIMRSYGEKWEGSKLKVEVWFNNLIVTSEEIVGFHDKNTSETYSVKMMLQNMSALNSRGLPESTMREEYDSTFPVGSELKIIFELVGGTTFKICGMALCDH